MNLLSIATAAAVLAAAPAFAGSLRSGDAKGSCSSKNEGAITLSHAAAFVDTKSELKPTLLIISDVKLPVKKWTSEDDITRSRTRFSGAVFRLGKDNEVSYAIFYWKGHQYSAAGYLKLTLDQQAGGEFTGSVGTRGKGTSARAQRTKIPGTFTEAIEYLKFDATFHTTLK